MYNTDCETKREDSLRQALAALLDVDPSDLSLTTPLGEQGVDSFIGLRFARKIEDLFGLHVEVEWLFDHPTIRELSRFFDELLVGGEK